ncbi:MAG: DUF2339 domain-containing protein [Novosphingobium sp.]
MIFWATVAGALFGWIGGDFSSIGFILGAMIGAGMGVWLRSAVRSEIASALRTAKADAPLAASPTEALSPVETDRPAAAVPLAEPPPTAQQSEPNPAAAELHEAPIPPPPRVPERVSREPREPNWAEQAIANARDWLLGGNTIVRVGLVILFVGLVFLANLAANAGLFPIEARLSVVALAGVALLVVGLLKRVQRPPFAMALQGTGVAVLYLTIFTAAPKGYNILPPGAAFGFMILIAALGVALALMQNSLTMAMASFLGGFAVPVLLGGKSDTPLALFSYLTVLNLAILFIAWKKSWRPLNLLGFFATFLLAAAWGFSAYEDRHFAICELFLIGTVAIYLAMAVLYAHNTPGKFGNFADSTLLFGTALAGFGLQAGLVHDRPFASAWSALGFGAAYLALTAFVLRRKQTEMRLLGECLLAIGVGFVTLAIPLALEAEWTSSAWALEGAGAFWVGSRQARWMPRLFGLLLQVLAALIAVSMIGPNISSVPLANSGFMVPMLVALPMLSTAWLLRNPLEHSGSIMARTYAGVEFGLQQLWFIGGFLFVVLGISIEISRQLPPRFAGDYAPSALTPHMQVLTAMLSILAAMALGNWFGRRRSWLVATWPGRVSLPLMVLCFLGLLIDDRHVLFWPDIAFWMVAAALHLWMLRHQSADGWTGAMHVGGVLLLTGMVADSLAYGIDQAKLWDTSWAGVTFLVSATAILLLLTRWAGRAAPMAIPKGLGWPRDPHARSYWLHTGLVLAALVYLGAMLTTLLAEGVTDPLPYIPLLNPVDLSALLALAVFALWRRMVLSAPTSKAVSDVPRGSFGLAAEAVLGFAIVNTMWLRIAHHFLGLEWDAELLAISQVVQTGYSILWTLIAMGLMIWARRRGERLPWLTGAVLLGVVVIKLVLVDMSRSASLARIIAFIGVGVLMLLIGYFVPLPPRKNAAEETAGK